MTTSSAKLVAAAILGCGLVTWMFIALGAPDTVGPVTATAATSPVAADASALPLPDVQPGVTSSAATGPEAAVEATAVEPTPVEPTAAEIELIQWARGRFAAASLSFPDVDISFHRDSAPCRGNLGTYYPGDQPRVAVCRTHDDPALERRFREWALLHELGHAWIQTNLDSAARERFVELRGAESWADRDLEWFDRGVEQAAEIMAWGLLDREPGFVGIRDKACRQLDRAYRFLTGRTALSPTLDDCAPDPDVRSVGRV